MKKSVALIYYSQSGQSQKLALELRRLLEAQSITVLQVEVKPVIPFAFPWSASEFFAQMPRCVCNETIEIDQSALPSLEGVEGVFLIHPVWFLSPSLPMQALLRSAWAKKELSSKKVLQVLTCRNMWFKAAQKTRTMLRLLNAEEVGLVPICDPSPNWASLITTPIWLLTGKQHALKALPPAGIPLDDLKLLASKLMQLQAFALTEQASYEPQESLRLAVTRAQSVSICMEKIGHKLVFEPWARMISAVNNNFFKQLLLLGFRLSLVIAIVILLPTLALCSRVASRSFVSFARKAIAI